MHLTLMRDSAKEMPLHEKLDEVTAICVWHCKYRTLDPLANYRNLETVKIATFPDATLEVFGKLKRLKWLRILHLPKVTSISPLATLDNLETLGLSTLGSWDSSGKVTTVESLAPLAKMKSLRHLELFGVRPLDKSLSDIYRCKGLKTARFSKFPKKEMERFYEETGLSNDWIPEFEFND